MQNEFIQDQVPEHVDISTELLNEVAEEFNAIQQNIRRST